MGVWAIAIAPTFVVRYTPHNCFPVHSVVCRPMYGTSLARVCRTMFFKRKANAALIDCKC